MSQHHAAHMSWFDASPGEEASQEQNYLMDALFETAFVDATVASANSTSSFIRPARSSVSSSSRRDSNPPANTNGSSLPRSLQQRSSSSRSRDGSSLSLPPHPLSCHSPDSAAAASETNSVPLMSPLTSNSYSNSNNRPVSRTPSVHDVTSAAARAAKAAAVAQSNAELAAAVAAADTLWAGGHHLTKSTSEPADLGAGPALSQEHGQDEGAGTGRGQDSADYRLLLEEARRLDLRDIADSGALQIAGRDLEGRVVILCTPAECVPQGASSQERSQERSGTAAGNGATTGAAAHRFSMAFKQGGFPAMQEQMGGAAIGIGGQGGGSVLSELATNLGESTELARLLLYFVALLDGVVGGRYVLVFCNTGFDWLSWSRYSFLGQLHGALPRRYRKNLQRLIIVHPSQVLKMFFMFGRLFLSPKVYNKVHFCEHVADLLELLPREAVALLPETVFLHDTPGLTRLSSLHPSSSGAQPQQQQQGSAAAAAAAAAHVRKESSEERRERRRHARKDACLSGKTYAYIAHSSRGGGSGQMAAAALLPFEGDAAAAAAAAADAAPPPLPPQVAAASTWTEGVGMSSHGSGGGGGSSSAGGGGGRQSFGDRPRDLANAHASIWGDGGGGGAAAAGTTDVSALLQLPPRCSSVKRSSTGGASSRVTFSDAQSTLPEGRAAGGRRSMEGRGVLEAAMSAEERMARTERARTSFGGGGGGDPAPAGAPERPQGRRSVEGRGEAAAAAAAAAAATAEDGPSKTEHARVTFSDFAPPLPHGRRSMEGRGLLDAQLQAAAAANSRSWPDQPPPPSPPPRSPSHVPSGMTAALAAAAAASKAAAPQRAGSPSLARSLTVGHAAGGGGGSGGGSGGSGSPSAQHHRMGASVPRNISARIGVRAMESIRLAQAQALLQQQAAAAAAAAAAPPPLPPRSTMLRQQVSAAEMTAALRAHRRSLGVDARSSDARPKTAKSSASVAAAAAAAAANAAASPPRAAAASMSPGRAAAAAAAAAAGGDSSGGRHSRYSVLSPGARARMSTRAFAKGFGLHRKSHAGSTAAAAAAKAAVLRRGPPDPRGPVMGVDIMAAVGQGEVPWVVARCMAFLCARGRLDTVGLFRVAGDGVELEALRNAVNGAQQVLWDPDEPPAGDDISAMLHLRDPLVVAQLLKAYFRELPEPIIPYALYPQVIAIARAAGGPTVKWVTAMKTILWKVPSAVYATLRGLFLFLRSVADKSAVNLMTAGNLAIVWAPNLIRPMDTNPFVTLRDLQFGTDTTAWLIERVNDVFTDDDM
ncbi:hypothetical protein JKP88DRAFT_354412 [Tribonema minus]|uniref:Rho-GAP domain-containing protein n=1 Tax=Tribonema minus TaxID=303371 RepID=A0A835Z007_9STRA|nr:hypothetical protein JKP88DRAFT_354412 [Tribonema minus]